METSTLIVILVILTIVLIPLLLSFLVYPSEEKSSAPLEVKKKKAVEKEETKVDPSKSLSFDEILAMFNSKKSSKTDLKEGIEQLVRHHGKIHAKLGDLPHPDFKRYMNIIMALCANPQADKNIIIALDQKLRIKNPKYGLNIDEAVDKGIAKRGF